MTVAELIEKLRVLDPTCLVCVGLLPATDDVQVFRVERKDGICVMPAGHGENTYKVAMLRTGLWPDHGRK